MKSKAYDIAGHGGGRFHWRWLGVTILLSTSIGCGNGLSSVHGTVSLDSKPIAAGKDIRGLVYFYPEGQAGSPAIGRLDENGSYQLMTGSQEGIKPGPYSVSISVIEMVWPKETGGMPRGRAVTPQRYSDPKSSGLRAEVSPGSNTLDFALVSKSE